MTSRPSISDARTLYLMRHAEPSLPPGGKSYLGWSDPPLSPAGRSQAAQWRPFFSGWTLAGVFGSDLQRSRQTARIVQTGQVQCTAALREINLGAWEGLTFAQVRARDPGGFAQRGRDPAHFRPPGGESFQDLQKRVVPALAQIMAATHGDLLIVGHAGVNRVILCHLLGISLANLLRIGQDYAGLNMIVFSNGGSQVAAMNCCPANFGC